MAAKDLEWYTKNFPLAMDTGEEMENKDEEQEAAEIKKKTEPPTKKFRQNKVCSYFLFAITGAYDTKALVLLNDLQFCL